jgi:hypothetical protein
MKPIITATRAALIPAISLPPEALDPFVDVAEADEPVAVPVKLALALEAPVPAVARAWPSVGSATLPSTNQPPAVELGQAGAVRLGVYAELGVPVGVRVFHCACRLEKSGEIGVGVPVRE